MKYNSIVYYEVLSLPVNPDPRQSPTLIGIFSELREAREKIMALHLTEKDEPEHNYWIEKVIKERVS